MKIKPDHKAILARIVFPFLIFLVFLGLVVIQPYKKEVLGHNIDYALMAKYDFKERISVDCDEKGVTNYYINDGIVYCEKIIVFTETHKLEDSNNPIPLSNSEYHSYKYYDHYCVEIDNQLVKITAGSYLFKIIKLHKFNIEQVYTVVDCK